VLARLNDFEDGFVDVQDGSRLSVDGKRKFFQTSSCEIARSAGLSSLSEEEAGHRTLRGVRPGTLSHWGAAKVAVDILSFVEGGKIDIKVKNKKQISKSMDEFTCHRASIGGNVLVQSRQSKISRLFSVRASDLTLR
jgi:hypothetical protein